MKTKETKALSETLFEEISSGISLKLVDLTDEEIAELESFLDWQNKPKDNLAPHQ